MGVYMGYIGPAKNHPWMLTTLGCPETPDLGNSSAAMLGLAKNHPWMLTTLGCLGTPDPRNSSTEQSLNLGILELRLTIPLGSAQEPSTEGFPSLGIH